MPKSAIVLDAEIRARLRALVEVLGFQATRRLLGLSRSTLERGLAGNTIVEGSRALIAQRLAEVEAEIAPAPAPHAEGGE